MPNDQPQSTNHYDFLYAPPPKRRIFSNQTSFKQRLLFVVGGGVGLIIIAIIFFSLIGGSSSGSTSGLLALAQQQTEMIRVATEAEPQVSQQTTKNFAATTTLVLTSDTRQLQAYMSKNGQKVTAKELSAKQSATTDSDLASALQNGDYDVIFLEIMSDELTQYTTTLKITYNADNSGNLRLLLQDMYHSANLLTTQASDATTAVKG